METIVFNKNVNKIIIVFFGDVHRLPPIISLVDNLTSNNYNVILLSENNDNIPTRIKKRTNFCNINILGVQRFDIISRVKHRLIISRKYLSAIKVNTNIHDILWITSPGTLRMIGRKIFDYKYILTVYDLEKSVPLFNGNHIFRFPIKKYAQKAWKIVVPEVNRAILMKVWWQLDKVPYCLPNKQYYYDLGVIDDDISVAIKQMKKESKKIILYIGVFGKDRSFNEFGETSKILKEDYAFYFAGPVSRYGSYKKNKEQFDEFIYKYPNITYLGSFKPPNHLQLLKYARIGLLTYVANPIESEAIQLNALYCAPNKIFEYAGSALPMVGTNVPGLKEPFEKYNIGVCCDDMKPETIANAIKCVDKYHDEMAKNCKKYYESVDLDMIVEKIINE